MASCKTSIEQYLLDLMLNLMIVLKSKFEQETHVCLFVFFLIHIMTFTRLNMKKSYSHQVIFFNALPGKTKSVLKSNLN